MILLDTSVLSDLMKPKSDVNVVAWVATQIESDLYISAITRAEIELGVVLLPEGKRKQSIAVAARIMLEAFADRCLVFGDAAATQYGQFVAHRTRMGCPIAGEEAQIASIALAHGLSLATRNVRDFEEIARLQIVDPWARSS